MGNIVLLDELTINKIAAGEVIERPASVIKEMLENSIDAGAKNITVEIKNGGISFIRITDNGKGIAKDDVEMAFERHATSKIRSADDLSQVKSMGFRGEALASIAAIANIELVSRTEYEELGTRIVVEGGNILSLDEIGCSKGTTITVRNLFYNTPVRYKFLKKDFTESGYIEDVITRISLVYPEVSIKFINSGKTVIQTSGNGDLKSVIYNIFGKDVANNIMNVEYEYEYIKIKGVIGKKEIARSNRSNQIFFVNKRYIKDKTLTSSVEQAFKGMLPFGKFPFLVLNLEMPSAKVDVNVHPAKLEVRFEDENIVFKAMYHAIKDTLLNKSFLSEREETNKNEESSNEAFKISGNINEINNTYTIQNYKNDEFGNQNEIKEKNDTFFNSKEENAIEKLRLLQEDLKKEAEKNPNIQLTNEYRDMEQIHNKLIKINEKLNENIEENEVINDESVIDKEQISDEDNTFDDEDYLPKALRKQKESFIPIMFKDSDANEEWDSKEVKNEYTNNNEEISNNEKTKNEYVNNEEIGNNKETKNEYISVEQTSNNKEAKNEYIVGEEIRNDEEDKNEYISNEEIRNDEEAKNEYISNEEIRNNEEDKNEYISDEEITNNEEAKNEYINNEEIDNNKNEQQETLENKEISDNDEKESISNEEINTDKKENEDIPLSFDEMYRKLFGKEPYGGRKVETVYKKEKDVENNYYTLDSKMEDSNVSLFEGEDENGKIQYKIIGIAFDTYIVIEIDKQLYIMDQQLAIERILYEKLKKSFFDEDEKSSQLLLLPDIITLTYKQMDIAKDNFYLFRKAGFILEEFGENTIKLSGVPEICIDLNTRELFEQTLEEINTVARNEMEEREEKFISTIAHKVADRENLKFEKEDISDLLDKLFELQNPFTSPQGKPIVIKMSKYEIERKFARK